jgi:hypothetical protein
MARAGVSLSVTGYSAYRKLAKDLRKAGRKDLRAALRKQIANAGRPVLDEVKAAVRTLPVTSRGGGTAQRRKYNVGRASTERAKASAGRRGAGLRTSIASATRLQVTAKGVRFVVNSARLPESQRSLPRHLDSEKGWRHPVFGDTHTWVHQKGKPYFATTIKRKAPAFRRAILDAMEQIRRDLDK